MKQIVRITKLNLENNMVEGVMKDGVIIQILVRSTGQVFRVPKEGELWYAYYDRNPPWLLGDRVPTAADDQLPSTDLEPGAARLDSTSLVSADGKPFITLDGGTVSDGKIIRWRPANGGGWVAEDFPTPPPSIPPPASPSEGNILTYQSGSWIAAPPITIATGMVLIWHISITLPTGFIECDGSSQLRTAYPALFAVIGTTYGSVDGAHFTLPAPNQLGLSVGRPIIKT